MPAACFVIVLFGAPLALSAPRAGAAIGIAISLGTTVSYLMLIYLSRAIGASGLMNPTLAAWVARLEANWAKAVAAAGDEVARTWRLYMSAARLGFERGELDVCQLLLAKPADDRPASVPLRPWW